MIQCHPRQASGKLRADPLSHTFVCFNPEQTDHGPLIPAVVITVADMALSTVSATPRDTFSS